MLPPELQAFAVGFPVMLLHAGVTLALLVGGLTVYVLLASAKLATGLVLAAAAR